MNTRINDSGISFFANDVNDASMIIINTTSLAPISGCVIKHALMTPVTNAVIVMTSARTREP